MISTNPSPSGTHFSISIFALSPFDDADLADLRARFRASGADSVDYNRGEPFQPPESGPVQHPLDAFIVSTTENASRIRQTIDSLWRIPGWDIRP